MSRAQRQAKLIFKPPPDDTKSNRLIEDITRMLGRYGIQTEVGIKTSGKVARKLAKSAMKNDFELVIAAGGDGTIEDVASKLIGKKAVLGIIPLGMMNNLARSIGVPLELEQACSLIGTGTAKPIDVGHFPGVRKHKQYFLETAGFGVSGVAFPIGQDLKKGRLGSIPAEIRKLLAEQPDHIEFKLDGKAALHAYTQLLTISNAPLMAFNFPIAPHARIDDGLLDVTIYEDMSKAELLQYFLAVARGTSEKNRKVKRFRARKVEVHSSVAHPIHSDKDPLPARRSMTVEILPRALRVIRNKRRPR